MWQGADKLILAHTFILCILTQYPPPITNVTIFFQALLERTGYTLDVTTGQRKYGGPPPDTVYSGVQPGIGTEVSIYRLICYLSVCTNTQNEK